MHLRRQLGQKTREMRLHRRRQLVHVIEHEHEHEAATIAAEVRENPIHHRASVEAWRGGGQRLIHVALPRHISDGFQ